MTKRKKPIVRSFNVPTIESDYILCSVVTKEGTNKFAEFTQSQIDVAIKRADKKDRQAHIDAEVKKGFVSRIFYW